MAATTHNPWIRSAGYDLLFFSTLWMAPILIYAFYGLVGFGVSAVALALAYHALLRLPHFVATLQVSYANKANWPHYRQHWVRFFAIPAGILVLWASPYLVGHSVTHWFRDGLFAVGTLWGVFHIGRQNFGILSLYRRRSGLKADREGSEQEKRVFDTLIAAAALSTLGNFFEKGDPRRVFADVTQLGLLFGAACFVLGYLFRAIRHRKQPITTWPAVLYFLTAAAVMVRWPIYDRLPTSELRSGMFFFVFNGHHCLAYLGLTFMMDSNKRETNAPVFAGWREGGRQFATWLAPLAGVSTLVLWVTTGAFTSHGVATLFTEKALDRSLGLLNGTFVVHYYIEALSWRFSDAHNRRTVLPLLRAPRLAPSAQPLPGGIQIAQ